MKRQLAIILFIFASAACAGWKPSPGGGGTAQATPTASPVPKETPTPERPDVLRFEGLDVGRLHSYWIDASSGIGYWVALSTSGGMTLWSFDGFDSPVNLGLFEKNGPRHRLAFNRPRVVAADGYVWCVWGNQSGRNNFGLTVHRYDVKSKKWEKGVILSQKQPEWFDIQPWDGDVIGAAFDLSILPPADASPNTEAGGTTIFDLKGAVYGNWFGVRAKNYEGVISPNGSPVFAGALHSIVTLRNIGGAWTPGGFRGKTVSDPAPSYLADQLWVHGYGDWSSVPIGQLPWPRKMMAINSSANWGYFDELEEKDAKMGEHFSSGYSDGEELVVYYQKDGILMEARFDPRVRSGNRILDVQRTQIGFGDAPALRELQGQRRDLLYRSSDGSGVLISTLID